MRISISLAAVAAFLPAAFAHISMDFPVSYKGGAGEDSLTHLAKDGSNYPCLRPTSYSSLESTTVMQPGQEGTITLGGSATHGGGSCQVSLTYDESPDVGSRFTVIQSIEGGCPLFTEGNGANGPHSLSYRIPEDAPAGKAIIAWTWFNRVGNREMYMRCAPITIGGSVTDSTAFLQRPEILKANIGAAGNGCTTDGTEGQDISFPDPGPVVRGKGSVLPQGNCGPSGTSPKPIVPVAPVTPDAPTPAKPILAPQPGVIKLPAPVESEAPIEAPIGSPIEAPVEAPAAPIETPATPIEIPATPIEAPVVEAPVVSKPVNPPSADAVPCNDPGAIVCTSSNTFALCNHGYLVPMGRTALGTSCAQGVISARAYPIRLSGHGHIRRRHGKF